MSPYHYTQCGLKNICIRGIDVKDDAGESYLHIPALGELHDLIAQSLLQEPRALEGDEFFFLRAEIGMGLPTLAEHLKIDVTVLEKWQQDNQVTQDLDFAFRAFFQKFYLEQLDDKATGWKEAFSLLSSYEDTTSTTPINIRYGEDQHYHREQAA